MIYYLYNIVLALLSPLLFIYFSWMGARDDRYTDTLDERYGRYEGDLRKPAVSRRIWIHAVSVGEVVGATPLIRKIRSEMAGVELVVSTTTKTGREIFRKTFGDQIHTFYFPFDFPWVVYRATGVVRPDVLVLMETELWPNVIGKCNSSKVPVLLLNGRVSDRMASAGAIMRSLYRWTFKRVAELGMQTAVDAERLKELGAPAEKVRVMGNMKFDVALTGADRRKITELDKIINPGKKDIFVAGSTHPGEEEIILDVFEKARKVRPGLALVLAPRHIERAGEVYDMAVRRGFSTAMRSRLSPAEPNAADVTVIDTIGELRFLYGISTVCFVGGSLIERGGHNVLEPAACGKAPFYGPYTMNFTDSVRALEQGGGGRPVRDGGEFADKLAACLADDTSRRRTDEMALKVMQENAGATERAFELIRKNI